MTAEREYENGAVYEVEVLDQRVIRKDSASYVILTVQPQAKLKSKNNPKSGLTPLPENLQTGKDVWLNFQTRAEQSFKDLKALGFESPEFIRLHPEHPKHVKLVNKKCYARVSYSPDRKAEGQEKEWWNLVSFATDKFSDLQKQYDEEAETYSTSYKHAMGIDLEEVPY